MTEDERTYMIDLNLSIENIGEDIPDEDAILAPIKRFIKKTVKTYSKTCRIVNIKTNLYETGYEEENVFEGE